MYSTAALNSSKLRAWRLRIAGDVFAVIVVPALRDAMEAELTSAERDIAEHVLRGDSNREIAEQRGTAVRTVANQLAAIYQKLGIASRAELVVRMTQSK